MTEAKERAKTYQRIRHWLELFGIFLTLTMLAGAIALSGKFYGWASQMTQARYGILALYFLFFSLYSMIIFSPVSFYSGFILEHRYSLSNQTFSGWLWEWTKKQLLSFGLMLALVGLLYALIWNFETRWWFLAWAAYAAVSLVLGKLFPVLIVPLFYKYSPISDETLRQKIEALGTRFGMAIQNVYSLNLSKTTKKANAAFTGLGKTKRVILGDTLLSSFTHREIEVVLAHELGHFKHHDIWKQFAFTTAVSYIGFWIAKEALLAFAPALGFSGAGDIQAFPLLCLVFFFFGLLTSPLGNTFSRWAEKQADQFALDALRDKDSFISAMNKLSEINLADPNPHPLVEFLFYDHPAIGKRIRMAEHYSVSR